MRQSNALQHINFIGLNLYDTHFYVWDYKLLALSCLPAGSPGDVCVLWLRMKFIAFRLCHGYDSLKLSKTLQPAICRIASTRKERNNQWKPNCFRFPLIKQQFQTISSLRCVKMLKSLPVIKRPRKLFIYYYLLSDREIAYWMCCVSSLLIAFPLTSRVARVSRQANLLAKPTSAASQTWTTLLSGHGWMANPGWHGKRGQQRQGSTFLLWF